MGGYATVRFRVKIGRDQTFGLRPGLAESGVLSSWSARKGKIVTSCDIFPTQRQTLLVGVNIWKQSRQSDRMKRDPYCEDNQ